MKILLTIGHQASGFESIHNALVDAGMANALPSKRENLLPQQLVSKLIMACNAQVGEFGQLSPGKLWSELLADLLFTNLVHPIWGWTDPFLIRLMGWLADFEPEIRFVLVYTSPEMTLAKALGGTVADATEMAACLSEWSLYNEELLRFYYRNRDRCLLVNSMVLANAPERLLTRIETQFSVTLNAEKTSYFELDAVTAVTTVLAKHFCAGRPEVLALQQELEAASSIDFDTDTSGLLTNAWACFGNLLAENTQHLSRLQSEIEQLCSQNTNLEEKIKGLVVQQAELNSAKDAQSKIVVARERQIEQLTQAKLAIEKQLVELQAKFDSAQKSSVQQAAQVKVLEQALAKAKLDAGKLDELEKLKRENADQVLENELLLTQLHQVQEDLEHYFLLSQEQQSGELPLGAISYPLCGISVDLRHDLPGDNWYYAETDGRWAGPGLSSTLQLPKLEDGRYQLDLDIVDAMAPEILDSMELFINEQPIVWERVADNYPALLRAYFTTHSVASNGQYWVLVFKFKHNISPRDHGSDDDRQLAIRLRSVTLLRCDD